MEKYLVVYNPSSGKEMGQQKMFQIAKNLLTDEDISMTFIATKKKGDAIEAAKHGCSEGYDMIIACGGDGTINEAVNGIMQSPSKTKLAILPTGTINDFATYMRIPSSIKEFTKMLKNKKTNMVDVGKVNDQYFINVVSGGAFTNIPHEVPSDTKTIFGKYAYYFQAALEIPNQIYKSYNLKVESEGKTLNLEALVFVVSNTPSTGGFKKMTPDAKFNDGLFDVVIFEKTNPLIMLEIFTGMASGDHVKHPKVHYFKTSEISIDSDDELTIDIDGEYGFKTPVNISIINEGIELLVP
ncbi:diacylglycerol kinase (ATP) [Dethiosulfatibacter aminovorans DSM 17477]|uniref:Diacylglycerol kinase (ATP) n=1 Tax=Dethiosulfatibacter aminovorans DSM 17477 TaxID=1121476 RepID=A0A1M6MBS0_9FIRM|nr:YegS/Rv2252/BmrU family lipid kinase [Dethiosulfatibacter aminovorans]SHJ80865.1 diacylglycerol kinase (ATP) [Dethiosulfatibacter aminovorans DSM 17477]